MMGNIQLTLKTPRYSFDLTFERNISIVRGFSGTGKSLLCNLLEQSLAGEDGISVKTTNNTPYIVMPVNTLDSATTKPWNQIIADTQNTLIFIDEMCDCLRSGTFAKVIKHTTNYYIIISRRDYSDLPYSINSIYEFRQDTAEFHRNSISNRKLYTFYPNSALTVSTVLTEDSEAGRLFFQHLFDRPVITLSSKTWIFKKVKNLLSQGNNNLLVVVDGAAFGPEWSKLNALLLDTSFKLYAPESLEWILLHSSYFSDITELQDILRSGVATVDWSSYFSAEKYFTALFQHYCELIGFPAYTKSCASLDSSFLSTVNIAYLRQRILPDLCVSTTQYFT